MSQDDFEMIETTFDEGAKARALASKGGVARAEALSKTDRHLIARKAAEARWGVVAVASHVGSVSIGGREFDCAVLEDGTRVINQSTLLTALDRHAKAKGSDAGPVLFAQNLMPYVSEELGHVLAHPMIYRIKGANQRANGYPARVLQEVCEVYLSARQDGRLIKAQEPAARAAEILTRGFARVGIVALVDEATGYQESRARHELQLILEQYVRAELRPWMKTFNDDFFKEVYRIHGWAYKPGSSSRPGVVGHFINKYVYEHLAPGVLDELRRLNPTNERGRRPAKHHQHLTPGTGEQALYGQIVTVTTLMRATDSKRAFQDLFEKVHPPAQQQLPLVVEVEEY